MSWREMMMATAIATADPDIGATGAHEELSDADELAIRMLARHLLASLRGGDATTAYGLLSPALRGAHGAPDELLDTVYREDPMLAASAEAAFGDLVLTPDGLAQVLRLRDTDGDVHRVLLLVRRADDQLWEVDGWLVWEAVAHAA